MRVLEKYLFRVFSSTFFPIFLTLFIVTSIIFLVKIASLTSVIQVNFTELIQLYSYSIPHILFYILPISYFIGLSLSISKLSKEDELIVITSFGLNPIKIIKIFLPATIILCIVLLIVSLGLRPKSDYLKESFLNIKKQDAQFNIKASEYGQKIGSWLIYVDSKSKNTFNKITLLQLEKDKDTIISSNFAHINNKNNIMSINLKDGKSFSISDSIKQINFDEMILSHTIPQAQNIKSLNDIIMYWDDRKDNLNKSSNFSFRILLSLFPLLSLFFIIVFGFFNPRYTSNKTTIYAAATTISFIILASKLSTKYPNDILYALPIFWFVLSYLMYHFTIKGRY